MDREQPPHPRPPAGAPGPGGGRPPQSQLAVVALALALVPCCPAIPLAGSMLGVVAHARIRRAGGALRGERMALAAMLLGSVLALVQMTLLQRYFEGQSAEQRTAAAAAVRTTLEVGASDWPKPALGLWAPSAEVQEADIKRMAEELEAALGRFVGIRLGDLQPVGGGFTLGRSWFGFISTGGGDRPVVVEALIAPRPRGGALGILPANDVRLRAIRVILADGRELVLGTPFDVAAAGKAAATDPPDP